MFHVVAPLAGAWIEMTSEFEDALSDIVAPLAGAWIEISYYGEKTVGFSRRSPCGSVD